MVQANSLVPVSQVILRVDIVSLLREARLVILQCGVESGGKYMMSETLHIMLTCSTCTSVF